ncbi:D-aminoacylase [soil metagenome]
MTDRLVVRGGLVVDGSGRPGRHHDVFVEGGTIVAIGRPSFDGTDATDATVIDATDRVVAPGFIDLHTHADYSVLAFPTADSALRQGVTTIAVGNCGGGIAPISEMHDVRPVSFAFRPEWGVETSWRTFPDYLDRLGGLGVNVAAMVPHGALRNAVMGMDSRPASASEMDRMTRLLDEAMVAGAVGMSTGLQYRPGCWAPTAEIRRLVEVVGRHDGMYATHMRDRSERYVAAITESLAAAADTGAHLQLSHVVARPNSPRSEIESALASMTEAAAAGRFGVDTFPEPWGPGLLVDLFPSELMEGDTTDILSRLDDPTTRLQMEAYIDAGASFLARVAGYDEIFLSWVPDRPDLVGVSLGSREAIGTFCCEVLVEAAERLREVGIRHIYADESALDEVLALSFCTVASDGIVTSGEDGECSLPWSASSYGFTARLLEHHTRAKGQLSLEEAIRRLTALPAHALGISDRGTVATGKRADLVIFDPDRIHDRASPTEMARHPSGIDLVVVNGAVAADSTGVTDARAGMLVI